MGAMNSPTGRRTGAAMLTLCALAPALLAAWRVSNDADAAHDAGVARVLGLAPDPWRTLDVVFDNALALAPIGTGAARAALAGGLVAAAASIVLFSMGHRLLEACARTSRLAAVIAAIAALTATLGGPWQTEGASVGGSVTGAFLILVSLGFASAAVRKRHRALWAAAAFSVTAAAGHEPLDGICAFAGCAALVGSTPWTRRAWATAWSEAGMTIVAAAAAGAAPWAIGLAHVRSTGSWIEPALAQAWLGETGASRVRSPVPFLERDAGKVILVLAVGGMLLARRVARARPSTAAFAVVATIGVGCAWIGAPSGPSRFGAPILAAHGALAVLAGVALQAIVGAVAAVRVPMARPTAAMVVLLVMVFPVEAADEVLTATDRGAARARATTIWDESAWGTLPPNSVVLIGQPFVVARALAARAQGGLRGDILFVAMCAGCIPPRGELAREPSLVAFWRDIELTGAPTEASLSQVAASRPVVTAYEPQWGAAVARHLVPMTIFDRFETEPRGSTDRRRGLDASLTARARLAHVTAYEPELAWASESLLRARAMALAADGDRGLAERAAADADAFAADDSRSGP
jgi:hypothetical protein